MSFSNVYPREGHSQLDEVIYRDCTDFKCMHKVSKSTYFESEIRHREGFQSEGYFLIGVRKVYSAPKGMFFQPFWS